MIKYPNIFVSRAFEEKAFKLNSKTIFLLTANINPDRKTYKIYLSELEQKNFPSVTIKEKSNRLISDKDHSLEDAISTMKKWQYTKIHSSNYRPARINLANVTYGDMERRITKDAAQREKIKTQGFGV